jgi:hypothetical protein
VQEEPSENQSIPLYASNIDNIIGRQTAFMNTRYSDGRVSTVNLVNLSAYNPAVHANFNKEDLGFSLLVRGISATSYPNISVKNESLPIYRNFAVGGYTNLYKNLKIGFELGNETFGLKYYNTSGAQTKLNLLNPLLFWSGVSIRGALDNKIEYLGYGQPFAQITIGGTKLGPVGKAVAGLQFSSEMGLTFLFGVEGSMLMYKNQTQWYSTEKLGVTYGMLYKF